MIIQDLLMQRKKRKEGAQLAERAKKSKKHREKGSSAGLFQFPIFRQVPLR